MSSGGGGGEGGGGEGFLFTAEWFCRHVDFTMSAGKCCMLSGLTTSTHYIHTYIHTHTHDTHTRISIDRYTWRKLMTCYYLRNIPQTPVATLYYTLRICTNHQSPTNARMYGSLRGGGYDDSGCTLKTPTTRHSNSPRGVGRGQGWGRW